MADTDFVELNVDCHCPDTSFRKLKIENVVVQNKENYFLFWFKHFQVDLIDLLLLNKNIARGEFKLTDENRDIDVLITKINNTFIS